MDDGRFDDIIKGKLEAGTEPQFDPAGLADLHHRMASISMSSPWYVRYRSELMIVASTTLIMFVLLWWQQSLHDQSMKVLSKDLKTQNELMGNLKNEISQLRSNAPDTVWLAETTNPLPENYASLISQIKRMRNELNAYVLQSKRNMVSSTNFYDNIPDTLLTQLIAEGIVKEDRGNLILDDRYKTLFLTDKKEAFNVVKPPRTVVLLTEPELDNAQTDLKNESATKVVRLSTAKLRDIEKHYRTGVDFNFGPELSITNGKYPDKSSIGIAFGILYDAIFSPSFSLEGGVKYHHRNYNVLDRDIASLYPWPGVDNSLGPLISIENDYEILEVPFNLKYRYPLTLKTSWLVSSGYSPNIYLSEHLEYGYIYDDSAGPSGNSALNVSSVEFGNKVKLYRGTINFGLGLSRKLDNSGKFETMIYYQKSVGQLGLEQINPNFLGFKGVYWLGKK